MVLINCHSREYSRFNYGNELFIPLSLAVGCCHLCHLWLTALYLPHFFFFLTRWKYFFATIHHTGDLLRDISQQQDRKKGRDKSLFRAVFQTLHKKKSLKWGIYQQLIYTGHISGHMWKPDTRDRRLEVHRSQGFRELLYVFLYSVSAFRLTLMLRLPARSPSQPGGQCLSQEQYRA